MLSTKEDETNEKVIRGLLKLPTNRNCFNCNSPAPPQFVCTSFLTFVCITCSGIHREFIHRVKSISMAKFTKEEVQALEKGGNQRARELYLNKWDMKNKKLPNSGNLNGIREFIKDVYVLKKYFSSHKSPGDKQFWSEFDRSAGKSSQPIDSSSLKTDSNVTSDEPHTLVNPYSGLKIPEDSGKYYYLRMAAGGESLIQSNTHFGYDVGPRIPWPKFPVTEEKTYEPKSVNPFDSPCEPDLGHGISLEMSSLHASLPNPPFETPFLSVPRPLFPWDEPTYMQGQQPSPQLTGQAAQLDQGIHFHR